MRIRRKTWGWGLLFSALMVLGCAPSGNAGEHPEEHPTKGEAKSGEKTLTKEDMAAAIEAHVKKETALKGGYFEVYDKKAKKQLKLTLVKVHKDRLSKVGEELYFACADFKTPEGKVYDLDIFMKGQDKDHMKVTEVSVHKEAEVARYTWYKEGGIWKKKPVAEEHDHHEEEHPEEHPSEHHQ